MTFAERKAEGETYEPGKAPMHPKGEIMQGLIQDPRTAFNFILAGRAIVTFQSEKTNARYTYKVRLAPKKDKNSHTTYFVDLLTGPNNEEDYSLIGIIITDVMDGSGKFIPNPPNFFLTKKAKEAGMTDATPSVRAMKWVLGHLPEQMPPQCLIFHAGHCGRCGRLLTVPESIGMGLGPECATKGMGI